MSSETKDAAKKTAAKKPEVKKEKKQKGPGIMETLASIFSKPVVGTNDQVIAEVAKATGKTLKHSTLSLYKSKWRAGGFPSQKGKHGTLNQPSEEKGKDKKLSPKLALAQAKEAGAKIGKDAKAAGMNPAEVKKAVREAEDKKLDQLGFVRNASGAVKPKG